MWHISFKAEEFENAISIKELPSKRRIVRFMLAKIRVVGGIDSWEQLLKKSIESVLNKIMRAYFESNR